MLDPMSLLDQPTSTLSAREAEKLFAAVAELKRRGIAVLYVLHRLSETKQLCDRAIVLRNGEIVSEHLSGQHQHDSHVNPRRPHPVDEAHDPRLSGEAVLRGQRLAR